jgi:cell division protein FtsN
MNAMSRLDYVTIAIVAAIVLILGFLVYKTISLVNKDELENTQQTEQTVADLQNSEDTYDEDEDYRYDDEGDIVKEDLAEALPATDIDLDDDELGDYDEIADEPTVDDYEADQAKEEEDYPSEDAASPEEYSDEPDDSSFSSEGDYMVIAGSYTVKANAESAAKKFRSQGYENAEVGIFNRGAYANVIVDRFDSSSSAQKLAKELKNKGIEAYVQKKKGK